METDQDEGVNAGEESSAEVEEEESGGAEGIEEIEEEVQSVGEPEEEATEEGVELEEFREEEAREEEAEEITPEEAEAEEILEEKETVEEERREMAKREEEVEEEIVEERLYTIPLQRAWISPRKKRTPRAVRLVKAFVQRHMKPEALVVSNEVNERLWGRGIQKPPRRIRVRAVRDKEGTVTLYLAEGD